MNKLQEYLSVAAIIGLIVIVAGFGLYAIVITVEGIFDASGIERKDHNYKEFCEAKHLIAIHTHDGWYCVQGESIWE